MSASTVGTGQPKSKSINVEVNMLHAWTLRRGELAREKSRHQMILAGVCVLSIAVTPMIWSLRAREAADATIASANTARLASEVTAMEGQTKSAMPTIERSDMLNRTHGTVTRYLMELREVINSAPGRVVLEQLDSEVMGGELAIKIVATSKDSGDMQRFVDRAGMGKQVLASNQVLARKENAQSNRIKFDYFKKVRVEE